MIKNKTKKLLGKGRGRTGKPDPEDGGGGEDDGQRQQEDGQAQQRQEGEEGECAQVRLVPRLARPYSGGGLHSEVRPLSGKLRQLLRHALACLRRDEPV